MASKQGAFALVGQTIKEKSMSNKEGALGALSSQIRSNDTNKRAFVERWHGLSFIFQLLRDESSSKRLQKKLVFLLNDILNTQDLSFPEGSKLISARISETDNFVQPLVDLLVKGSLDVDNAQSWDLREFVLLILGHIMTDSIL